MNKARIKEAVLNTLRACGESLALPVPIKKIVKSAFPNARLIPFSKQMERHKISYKEMVAFAGTLDACTDYYADSDSYIIYYNDVGENKIISNRYRWNIAHELGHIALGHHKKYEESRIFRNNISNELYSEMEAEADMFAAYILVPHIVIKCVMDKTQHLDIKSLCKVSESAANIRNAEMQVWDKRNRVGQYDFELLAFFSSYVEENAHSKSIRMWLNKHRACPHCSAIIERRTMSYCQICGWKLTGYYEKEKRIMIYSKILLDNQGRALECPVCRNTELTPQGNFCIICGQLLINVCSVGINLPPYDNACHYSGPLPGNARYCPYCGAESTFMTRKVLFPWDDNDGSNDSDGNNNSNSDNSDNKGSNSDDRYYAEGETPKLPF